MHAPDIGGEMLWLAHRNINHTNAFKQAQNFWNSTKILIWFLTLSYLCKKITSHSAVTRVTRCQLLIEWGLGSTIQIICGVGASFLQSIVVSSWQSSFNQCCLSGIQWEWTKNQHNISWYSERGYFWFCILSVSNQCHTLQTIHTRHTTTSPTKGINPHTNTILW